MRLWFFFFFIRVKVSVLSVFAGCVFPPVFWDNFHQSIKKCGTKKRVMFLINVILGFCCFRMMFCFSVSYTWQQFPLEYLLLFFCLLRCTMDWIDWHAPNHFWLKDNKKRRSIGEFLQRKFRYDSFAMWRRIVFFFSTGIICGNFRVGCVSFLIATSFSQLFLVKISYTFN